MKIQIFSCTSHDESRCYIDGKIIFIFSNDYGVEKVLRIARHLGWEVERIKLSSAEYEKKDSFYV